MTIRVIDIETTGIDATKDAIVEIASVDLTANGEIKNPMGERVNPGRPIPAVASAIHHIIDADVEGMPALADVFAKFDDADAYIAHNAKFEQSFFAAAGLLVGKPWVCTYKCALRVWPDLVSHSNQALRYELGLIEPFGIPRLEIRPHGASSDVIVTGAVFVALMCVQGVKWSDLVRWSAEPALHTIFSFGKHRGQRYDAVPEDYLFWILDKSDLDADVKFSARQAIERKRANASTSAQIGAI